MPTNGSSSVPGDVTPPICPPGGCGCNVPGAADASTGSSPPSDAPGIIPPPGAAYNSETGASRGGHGGGATKTIQGNSWFQSGLPWVAQGDAGRLAVVQGVSGTTWWKPGGGGLVPEFGSYMRLRHDTARREYVLTSAGGAQKFFHDFDPSVAPSLRGQLKAMWDPARLAASITRDGDNQITSIAHARAGRSSAIQYAYHGAGAPAGFVGLIRSVTRVVDDVPQSRESYQYYGDGEPGGSAADLRRATGEEFDGSSWEVTGEDYFRYYKAGEAGGFAHAMKLRLGAAAVARAARAGVDLDAASDAQLEAYSDDAYSYDAGHRVSSRRTRGGTRETTFSYLQNAAGPGFGNHTDWYLRTEATLPSGDKNIAYTLRAGAPILSSRVDAGGGDARWTATRYNPDFRPARGGHHGHSRRVTPARAAPTPGRSGLYGVADGLTLVPPACGHYQPPAASPFYRGLALSPPPSTPDSPSDAQSSTPWK